MRNRLDATVTPVTFREVADALETSWDKLLSHRPKREALAVLLAQSALETGHWKKSYCFNLGNAKATPAWEGDYCFFPADEIVSEAQASLAFAERAPRTDGLPGHNVSLRSLSQGRVQVTLFPDHPWCRFRAFTSLTAGADDYIELLHRRFRRAWPALEAGDPEQFVRALHASRYFTASVERYLPPVLQLFGKFSSALASSATPVASLEATLPLPNPATGRPTLRRGAHGPAVAEVQRILLTMGYEDVPETGVFDEATARVVELFQLQHVDERGVALVADGEVGKHTWWALLNPSGPAQQNFLAAPGRTGLTETRRKLLELLDEEHAKPVFEAPDGSNRSPDIDRYFARTGILGKPWCCAFVSWALQATLGGLPIAGKYHLGVQGMWVAARDLGMAVTEPKPGDIFIQIKSAGTGHTGFVVGVSTDGRSVYTCEGNCGNRVKYGQRPITSIHHFIDVLRDGQSAEFPRGSNLRFEDVDSDGTT